MPAARKARRRRQPPSYVIANRVVRLRPGTPDATTWPWPFGNPDEDGPAWKARYAPERLTPKDLGELARIADAYRDMLTHPCRSVADRIHDLRSVLAAERERELEVPNVHHPEDP